MEFLATELSTHPGNKNVLWFEVLMDDFLRVNAVEGGGKPAPEVVSDVERYKLVLVQLQCIHNACLGDDDEVAGCRRGAIWNGGDAVHLQCSVDDRILREAVKTFEYRFWHYRDQFAKE